MIPDRSFDATPNALNRFATYERAEFLATFVTRACKFENEERVASPDQLKELTARAI